MPGGMTSAAKQELYERLAIIIQDAYTQQPIYEPSLITDLCEAIKLVADNVPSAEGLPLNAQEREE